MINYKMNCTRCKLRFTNLYYKIIDQKHQY